MKVEMLNQRRKRFNGKKAGFALIIKDIGASTMSITTESSKRQNTPLERLRDKDEEYVRARIYSTAGD